ncbi:MAG: zf-HC2 domain-containing protein [Chloroflexi bacterium]|nr:zf-HC2 domain-containing protein [Chloroflexota bacterium]
MHQQWEDLLPFYAAGTLDASERAALEQHLAGCELCRQALMEWRVIGDAVRAEAQSWTHTLPMPRYELLPGQAVSHAAPGAASRAGPRRTRRALGLVSLAASLAAVLLVGALIAFMAGRVRDQHARESGGLNVTSVLLTAPVTPTRSDLGILSATLTLVTNTPGGIMVAARPSDTPPAPRPTLTPIAPIAAFGGGSDTPLLEPTPVFGCVARAANLDDVPIYRTPGSSEVVDTLRINQWVNVIVADGSGWYEVFAPNINLPGWVWGTQILLAGGDCAQIPLPSATLPATPAPCTASSSLEMLVRPDPYDTAPLTGRIAANEKVAVLASSDNGWIFVQAPDSTTGWVPAAQLVITGTCADVPYISGYLPTPAPSLPPDSYPTYTPTPPP